MALDATTIERFARQIIIPEVGVEGQERLCASVALLPDAGPVSERAACYLEAAGVTVRATPRADEPYHVLAAPLGWDGDESPAATRVWWRVTDSAILSGYGDAAPPWPSNDDPSEPSPPAWLAAAAGAEVATLVCLSVLGLQQSTRTREVRFA